METQTKGYDPSKHEVMAERDRLRTLNGELLAALKPFAAFADYADEHPRFGLSDELYSWDYDERATFRLSDCKAARAAIAKAETP